MKAYLTTIGEKTTGVAKAQLERFGFEVVVLDMVEPWINKYIKFLDLAYADQKPCIRVDADVIVNENVKIAFDLPNRGFLMAQFTLYDLYQNGLHIGQPVYYSPAAINLIYKDLDKLDRGRPETSAWRLPEINEGTFNIEEVAGMHGFFQDRDAVLRAIENKKTRGQMQRYDFDLVDQLTAL